MKKKHIELEHVGIVLWEEFMGPHKLSMNALARVIGVPPNRIHGILHGTRRVTADTDLRLTKFFGLSEGYFLRVQECFDISAAKLKIGEHLKRIIPLSRLKIVAIS
jgi:addiction module HigA family antidote